MRQWTTTWAQAHCGTELFSCNMGGRTLEVTIPVTVEGEAVRLRFSAPYEKQPVLIQAVSVMEKGIVRQVSFADGEQLLLKPGETAMSSPIKMALTTGSQLIVRIAYGEDDAPVSGNALITAQYSIQGNYTMAEDFPISDEDICRNPNRPFHTGVPVYNLCGVDILSKSPASATAILGDSNTFSGVWTKPLEARIKGPLLNLGISGNRLLGGTGQTMLMNLFGIAALKRFEWDVLPLCGLKTLIISVGGNDIFQPGTSLGPPQEELPSVKVMIDGYIQLDQIARGAGITTVCSTLTPAGGAEKFDREKEELRCAVNNWIRRSGVFDYILDIAGLVEESGALRTEFDSGDHLHLNKGAGRHIADAIDISIFEGRREKC